MRTLRRNKQAMKYSIKGEQQPIYVLDENGNKIVEFVDADGNVYYKETGSYTSGWSEPIGFYGNIAMSGGEAEAQEYGISLADYNAVIVLPKETVPLVEGTLIWLKSEVRYLDEQNTEIDKTSADFEVIKVSESINQTKYILQAIVK